MNILMVGYNNSLFESIKNLDENLFHITVLEEKELFLKKKLNEKKFPHLKNFILCEYQQSESYMDTIKEFIKDTRISFNGVIAGLEYGVPAANHIAKEFNLASSNVNNSIIFNDKLKFREFCKSKEIPQPKFTEVKSVEDIYDFYNGSKIVIKPANRQASLGVIKVQSIDKIDSSWSEVLSISEETQLVNRELSFNYLVEECVSGQEVSTEVFVFNNQVQFINITDKDITTGKYSVELGHTIPTLLNKQNVNQLHQLISKLVNSLEFSSGILHIEWIISSNGPKIIECAARPPGDQIFQLIKLSYGFDPYVAYLTIMSNNDFNFPENPTNSAAIRFFNVKEGVLESIDGINILQKPQVINWHLKIKVGDTVNRFSSSWDRVGHFMIKDTNLTNVKKLADTILKEVKFQVK